MLDKFDFQQLSQSFIPASLQFLQQLLIALIIFVVGKWLTNKLSALLKTLLVKAKVEEILADFVSAIVKGALILVIIIAALDALGVDTTSLVAIIGAAGLAVGLALQNSLQNFAAGVMLLVFRPFKAGDFVETAGVSGVIETISIFSTTMRTGDNKEMIIPNGKIYGDNITNFSAKSTRRIDMVVGIGYEDNIQKAKEIIQSILNEDGRVLDEPETLIAVGELADSSINFFVRPWVKAENYWPVKFDFNESIKERFDEAGISIPYPQMDVHQFQGSDAK